MRAELTAPAAGSSPLARGLRGHGPARDEFGRIIPACAGFTQGHRADAPGPPDHPRLRGVYKVFGVGPDLRVGSSPLARGLPGVRAAGSAVARIIPACAGFTPRWIGGPRHERDHPRLRGVYSSPSPHPGSGRGSSPLARGLPLTSLSASLAAGIIPARAGFTAAFSGRGRQRGDHPRSRGVYGSGRSTRRAASGSSPLARGLRRTGPGDQGRPGIIPARAGFTTPHACLLLTHAGSSPLARGLRHQGVRRRLLAGIIPARAGFTDWSGPP